VEDNQRRFVMKKRLVKLTLNRETVLNLELQKVRGELSPQTQGGQTCKFGFCYTNGCPFTFPCGIDG
jgi:hypothetical protein